jgi:hypothetical protein
MAIYSVNSYESSVSVKQRRSLSKHCINKIIATVEDLLISFLLIPAITSFYTLIHNNNTAAMSIINKKKELLLNSELVYLISYTNFKKTVIILKYYKSAVPFKL